MSNVSDERLAELILWLDRKWARHKEEEDFEAANALREFAELRKGWRPIATAPKDGTLIWVGCPGSMRIASWSEDRWRDFYGEYPRLDVLFTPTNWRPLPPPLSTEAAR